MNIQGPPPPGSAPMHPNKEEVKQKHQEACSKKEATRGWKQGQVAWQEYREIV